MRAKLSATTAELHALTELMSRSFLGEGKWSMVWKMLARNGAPYAVKVVRDDLSANEAESARRYLLHEMGVLARLSGRVEGIPSYRGGYPGVPALCLEYVEGSSLALLDLHNEVVPVDQACDVGKDAARILAEIHRLGAIHGDIGLSNVMLTDDGRTFLVDFGGCRILPDSELLRMSHMPELVPQAARLCKGSPAFASPERALGRPVVPRSDVYSLAAMLYVMMTGQPVFGGADKLTVYARHIAAVPRPISELMDIPAELAGIIMACLRKQAKRRPSAAQLAQALAEWASAEAA